ncbi:MAG: hypothetical protein HYW69_00680 [Candidatus Nealsonbacteria bacterium]|nr:hypothetical protein [Candidatus Nealsonbacteria bacterium]
MEGLTAAYIGRFQPFGKHHRKLVQFIDSRPDVKGIVIVKGGSQWNDKNYDPYSSPDRNPFTADECCGMINLSLKSRIKKPYKIVRVADTKSKMTDPLWKEWVEAVIFAVGDRDFLVYVNEPHTVRAFETAGIQCRSFLIENLGPRATIIRDKIAFEPEDEWSKYVDPEVAGYLKRINASERVRRLL